MFVDEFNVVVLVTGDADFAHLALQLRRRGIRVEVAATTQTLGTGLKGAANEVIDLVPLFETFELMNPRIGERFRNSAATARHCEGPGNSRSGSRPRQGLTGRRDQTQQRRLIERETTASPFHERPSKVERAKSAEERIPLRLAALICKNLKSCGTPLKVPSSR